MSKQKSIDQFRQEYQHIYCNYKNIYESIQLVQLDFIVNYKKKKKYSPSFPKFLGNISLLFSRLRASLLE